MGMEPGDVLDTGDGTCVLKWIETSGSTGGARQVVEWTLGRMTRNPLHWHPVMTETFEVLDGELVVEVDGNVRTLHAGEAVEVPPGTRHRFQVDDHARWRQTNAPVLNHELLFRIDFERMQKRGANGGPGFIGAIRTFQVMDAYVVGPPLWFQKGLRAFADRLWPIHDR